MAGVEAVTLASPVGEFGVAYAKLGHAQPGFDDAPGAKVYPVFHVIRGLERGRRPAACRRQIRMTPSDCAASPGAVARRCICGSPICATSRWRCDAGWLPAHRRPWESLDEQSFDAAVKDSPRSATNLLAFYGTSVKLAPLATAWLAFEE